MSSRPLKPYSLLLFLFVFLASAQSAEACSCGGSPTVLDSFNWAEVVVVVSAVSVEKAEPEKTAAPGRMSDGENYVDGVKSTTMRVEQVFKGGLKVGEEMIFGQGGGADCVWTFSEQDIGKKFLFYLKISPYTPWFAGTCGRSSYVEYKADDLLYLNNLEKVRNKTRISGTIRFRYEGESLAGRKIRIVGTKGTQELKTDQNGVYEIYDLPAGRYFVEVEIPKGWKIAPYWLRYAPSLDRNAKDASLQKIPIILEANKHAGLDLLFDVDNVIRGNIYDPLGQPMNGVCLHLIPADGSKGPYLGDCTEKDGAFTIDEIPPGGYVIIVNDDGEMTSTEPFKTFYYPKALKREEATVFNIGLGDIIENVAIHPPIELKTITVEGVLLYADGKPVADESVAFKPVRKKAAENEDEEDDDDPNEARATTDQKGRFSIKIVQGANGSLYGWMYSYVGKYQNCPQLDNLVKKAGNDVPAIKTAPMELRATTNMYEVELKFPFPSCKEAKRPN